MEVEIDMVGEDPLLDAIEHDLAAVERRIADLSERRSELSIQLGQIVKERDDLLGHLASLRRGHPVE